MSSQHHRFTIRRSPEKGRRAFFSPFKLLLVIVLLIGVIAGLLYFMRFGGAGYLPGSPRTEEPTQTEQPAVEFRDRAVFLSGRESNLDDVTTWLEQNAETLEIVEIVVWDSALARDVEQFEALAREKGVTLRRIDRQP